MSESPVEALDSLNREIKRLEKELSTARKAAAEVELQVAHWKFGIEIGKVVIGKDGNEYMIRDIETRPWREKPWIMASPRKKDGAFGSSVRHLFDKWIPPLAISPLADS